MKYSAKIQQLFDTFFGSQPNLGDTAPQLRQCIEQYAANLSEGFAASSTLPVELEPYIQKITQHAYKVTDEDVAELRALGYTEDDLFEITISAALGAGRARLSHGLAALRGDTRAGEEYRGKSIDNIGNKLAQD